MRYIPEFIPPRSFSLFSGDALLVALSGGADSTLLLTILSDYCKKEKISLLAAHVNHMIRGAEADRDERFCRELCNGLGVELVIRKADVPALAAELGQSLETCARQVRYDFFRELLTARGIGCLATAHNADDNLETILFNIARGSGLRGACGIPPERELDGHAVIRPLIRCKKADIIDFCHGNGIDFVTDSTNSDDAYSRNRIRSHIIPELCTVSSGAIDAATRFSTNARCDDDFISGCARASFEELSKDGLPINKLRALHPAIAGRVVMLALDRAYGKATDTRQHTRACFVEAILELCRVGREHSSVSLPESMQARIENGGLVISRAMQAGYTASTPPSEAPLHIGENRFGDITVRLWLGDADESIFNHEPRGFGFDIPLALSADIPYDRLTARARREGDLLKRGTITKKVKDIMSEARVPLELRDAVPIVLLDGEVIGIPGIRGAVRHGLSPTRNSDARVLYINAYPTNE